MRAAHGPNVVRRCYYLARQTLIEGRIMWAVFATFRVNGVDTDKYSIEETESEAAAMHQNHLEDDKIYCCGYAEIKQASEPHWVD
jgi:hypothetical protein